MGDIQELKQKLLLCQDNAKILSAKFDGVQLAIFRDTKNNANCNHCGGDMYRFCQRICSNVKLLLIISIRICKVNNSITFESLKRKHRTVLRMIKCFLWIFWNRLIHDKMSVDHSVSMALKHNVLKQTLKCFSAN